MSKKPPKCSVERTYQTDEGTRLNCAAACRILGVKPGVFFRCQREGWAVMGGDRLAARALPTGLRRGRRGGELLESTYLESAVLKLRDVPVPRDGVFDTPTGVRLNRTAAMRELGVCYETLRKMVAAKELTAEGYRQPTTGHEVETYAREQVEAVKQRRAAPPPDRRAGEDGWYVCRARAQKRLKVTGQTLTDWSKRCIHLADDGAIRTMSARASTGAMQVWYHEDDVRLVKAAIGRRDAGHFAFDDGLYLSAPAVRERYEGNFCWGTLGRLVAAHKVKALPHPSQANALRKCWVYRDADLAAALEARRNRFDGIFPTPDGPRYNLRRAARESGFSVNFLKKQIKVSAHLRPEGKLPTVPMEPPRQPGRQMKENTVLPADLDRLRAAINASLAQGKPEAGWGDAREAAARFGVEKREDQIYLCVLLKEWRGEGRLGARRVWREWARADQASRQRVWVYDLDQIERLLDPAPTTTPKNVGGHPGFAHTRQINEACYDLLYRQGMTRGAARLALQERFAGHYGVPTHNSHVKQFAERHVKFVEKTQGVRLPLEKPKSD